MFAAATMTAVLPIKNLHKIQALKTRSPIFRSPVAFPCLYLTGLANIMQNDLLKDASHIYPTRLSHGHIRCIHQQFRKPVSCRI